MMIFGLGQFAMVMDYHLQANGFTVHREFLPKDFNVPAIAYEDMKPSKLLIAIGPAKVNEHRERIYLDAKDDGHELETWLSDKAIYNYASIGEHCIVFEGNNLQPFTEIGNNVVLWSGNHVGHHSKIGDHCFITSHCVISGGVEIGERSFLGVNCTIHQGVKIGKRCVVPAGAVVSKDMPDDSVYGSVIPSSRVKL